MRTYFGFKTLGDFRGILFFGVLALALDVGLHVVGREPPPKW